MFEIEIAENGSLVEVPAPASSRDISRSERPLRLTDRSPEAQPWRHWLLVRPAAGPSAAAHWGLASHSAARSTDRTRGPAPAAAPTIAGRSKQELPMAFGDSIAIPFTNEQWSRLAKLYCLRTEARADLEGCVGFYRFSRDRAVAYRRAIGTSDDRKRWRRKILDLLKDLEETALAHPHVVDAVPWIADLKDFADELKRRKLPPGPNTQAARQLVELTAFFFEKHANLRATRSYKSNCRAFVNQPVDAVANC
jgi:hypothetical protein